MNHDLASVTLELLAGLAGLAFCWILGARRAGVALFWASCLIIIRRISQENISDGVAGSIFPIAAGRWMLYAISALKVYAGVEGIIYVGSYILPLFALLEDADHDAVGHRRTSQGLRARWIDRALRSRLFGRRRHRGEGADFVVATSLDPCPDHATSQPACGRTGEDLRGRSESASGGIDPGPRRDPETARGTGRTRSAHRRIAPRPGAIRSAIAPAAVTVVIVAGGWWIAEVATENRQLRRDLAEVLDMRIDEIAAAYEERDQ